MIERAELWVQRNRTLKAGVMKLSVAFVTSDGAGYRCKMSPHSSGRPPQQSRAMNSTSSRNAPEVGAVIHHPALPLNQHKAGAAEYGEMCRHGVVRHVVHARDIAGVEAVGMNFQETAKDCQPGGLAQRAKSRPPRSIRP